MKEFVSSHFLSTRFVCVMISTLKRPLVLIMEPPPKQKIFVMLCSQSK